ncbi:hypothetical protein MtrunA17_Chr3g0088221 [Medicago truncatula]|uniref:Transmembrane protein n=1 Tax=Medicago truncatula TaxID=3880 RepID=A0A396IKF9_MEDTR|nr:hypothetical protein MtrunA17_Chr3g0088221 [Medicago truncatula]
MLLFPFASLPFFLFCIEFLIFFLAYDNKHGVPIKTTVSATVLEETLYGSVTIRQLSLGQLVSKRVEKQCAHSYLVTITVTIT